MLLRVSLSFMMVLFLGSCAISTIRDREYLSLLGKVIIDSNSELPANAQLHVLLTESSPEEADDIVIATDSKVLTGKETNLAFSIPYSSDAITKDSKYLLLACVTVAENVILISKNDVQVLTLGHPDTGEILLGNQTKSKQYNESNPFSKRRTLLQRGVQSNLADVCRQKSPGYDHITRSKASKILSADLLKGPLHQVREQVDIHGPYYFFVIDSQYGQFTAQGMVMLNKVINEIYAIESLMKITRSDAYLKATGETFVNPFAEVRELVMNPIDTVSGIPKGAFKIIKSTMNTLTTGRSQYEDSYAKAFITVSKYKRRHASSLGVDVYSSNPLLQRELDRLGWVEALGNWTPSVVLIPLSGPGSMVYKAFSWTETLNRALVEKTPDFLREQNESELVELGIPLIMRKNLLGHEYYSPRHATILVKALVEIKGVKGLDLFVQEALKAESEIDALTFQQTAELLAGYHKNQQKIIEIFIHKGLPVGYTQEGTVVTALPVDYFRWTPFGENTLEGIDSVAGQNSIVTNKSVLVTGSISPIAKRNFKELGFDVSEHIQKTIELMD